MRCGSFLNHNDYVMSVYNSNTSGKGACDICTWEGKYHFMTGGGAYHAKATYSLFFYLSAKIVRCYWLYQTSQPIYLCTCTVFV